MFESRTSYTIRYAGNRQMVKLNRLLSALGKPPVPGPITKLEADRLITSITMQVWAQRL